MSSLRDKMYNYEVTPPANSWEKIKLALNEEANEFPEKLRQYEVKPPVRVWEKINSELNAEQNIPVRKPDSYRVRRISPVLKYAAAAVLLIGLITFGVMKFSSKTSGENEFAEKGNKILPKDSSTLPKTEFNTSETTSTITDQQRDDAALEESKKTYAKLDLSETNKRELRKALIKPVSLISSESSDDNYPEVCFPDYIRKILANSPMINTADRYIMLMTPDGNIIRVSKKWADLVCCVSGEDEADECKDQLSKWRQKLATSSVAPSPANFMDILNMVELLKDNNP